MLTFLVQILEQNNFPSSLTGKADTGTRSRGLCRSHSVAALWLVIKIHPVPLAPSVVMCIIALGLEMHRV